MKKTIAILLIIVAMSALILTGCAPMNRTLADKSASIVTLDVNPGVKIYLSSGDAVLGIEATNEDGTIITEEVAPEVEKKSLEEAIQAIVDELYAKGYLTEENISVLISVEKDGGEIEVKVREKLTLGFERHGKHGHIISWEHDDIDEEDLASAEALAAQYEISVAKAYLILELCEEFPTLDPASLAEFTVNDLALMLDDADDMVRRHFKRWGEYQNDKYIGRDAALEVALTDLGITEDAVLFEKAHLDREDGRMVYEVEIITEGMEYEYEIDAETGAIIESESEVFEMPDLEEELREYFGRHGAHAEQLLGKDKFEHLQGILNSIPGHHIPKFEIPVGGASSEERITSKEALRAALADLGITEAVIEEVEVRFVWHGEMIFADVKISTVDGKEYRATVEATRGEVISASEVA